MRVVHSLIVPAVACLTLGSANSAPLTAPELLNAYNLIVFGNSTSSSHVDGKAYIGGNAVGGEYNGHKVNQGAGLPSLTVGKNLSGNVNVNGPGIAVGGNFATGNYNGNGGGNAYVGGNWTGNGNFNLNGSGNVYLGGTKSGNGNVNGGTLFQNQSSPSFTENLPTAATTSYIQNTLTDYSASLANLTFNSNIALNGNTATFNAAPDAQGLAIFEIADAMLFFSTVGQITFNLNGASEMIINVFGGAGSTINLAANFLGGQAQARSLDTLWNFVDATDIKLSNQFGGSILATLAKMTVNQNLEGTLVAASLIQNAEIHYNGPNLNYPTPEFPDEAPGQTPLPASAVLFITGLGALGLIARRRKQRNAA